MGARTDGGSRQALGRELELTGAILMGLGAMVGTGVFVSIGIAADVAGAGVLIAIAVATCVAFFNALSAAQLAAAHPVSGGTYEYGYRYLSPALGFTAGWLFLSAKSASAATAALGCAGYVVYRLALAEHWRVPLALLAVLALTTIVLAGIRRSNTANVLIVGMTLVALTVFVLVGLWAVDAHEGRLVDFRSAGGSTSVGALLQASALMFVAFTGYGRIATLGEEVRTPRTTIPRAIVATLALCALLYISVAGVALSTLGAPALAAATQRDAAPLEAAARALATPGLVWLVALGAVTAMLGVLLNLVLGLSRVVLAMGRRGDMPRATATIDASGTTPYVAVLVVGGVICAITLIGSVETTWRFSAFTVLVYYALTNIAALRLPARDRLYPRVTSVLGLIGCLGLAFWVDRASWFAGVTVLAVGLAGRALWRAVDAARD